MAIKLRRYAQTRNKCSSLIQNKQSWWIKNYVKLMMNLTVECLLTRSLVNQYSLTAVKGLVSNKGLIEGWDYVKILWCTYFTGKTLQPSEHLFCCVAICLLAEREVSSKRVRMTTAGHFWKAQRRDSVCSSLCLFPTLWRQRGENSLTIQMDCLCCLK